MVLLLVVAWRRGAVGMREGARGGGRVRKEERGCGRRQEDVRGGMRM